MPLQVARGGLHRRLLGGLDGITRQSVDPSSPSQLGQALLLARCLLGQRCDLLRVDRVLLDPRSCRRLVVPCPLHRPLCLGDLDLEALPGSGVLGDRPQRVHRGRLLLDLERRRIPPAGEVVRCLTAEQAIESRGGVVDRRDVVLLTSQQRLGRGEIIQSEARELPLDVGACFAQFGLHLRAASNALRDLLLATLGVELVGAAEPRADKHEDGAQRRKHTAQRDRCEPGSGSDGHDDGAEGEQAGPRPDQRAPSRRGGDLRPAVNLVAQQRRQLEDPAIRMRRRSTD